MKNSVKRVALIILVIVASSAWYFLAPLFIDRAANDQVTSGGLRSKPPTASIRSYVPSVTTTAYESVVTGTDRAILVPISSRHTVAGAVTRHRCRTWTRTDAGSAALETIACPISSSN